MKLGKRIAALGATVVMIMSVSAVGVSAACGGATMTKTWLTNNGNAFYRRVKYIGDYGDIRATYLPSSGVKCTSYGGTKCNTQYARVGSGGKYKEGRKTNRYIPSETGFVSLKNNKARFEGWYNE